MTRYFYPFQGKPYYKYLDSSSTVPLPLVDPDSSSRLYKFASTGVCCFLKGWGVVFDTQLSHIEQIFGPYYVF